MFTKFKAEFKTAMLNRPVVPHWNAQCPSSLAVSSIFSTQKNVSNPAETNEELGVDPRPMLGLQTPR